MAAALLLAPAASAEPAIQWSKGEPISVVMVDDRFMPDRLMLSHGIVYALDLENHGKHLHEFTAPEFFANTVLRDPGQLANAGKEIVVQPGQTVIIHLVPRKAGTFPLTCADHDWDGMEGEIVVQ